MERLVLVCQSAYMLSRGENISEQTLAVEAAALLKALQQRTKEEPDAYKRPMYIGIYPVGPPFKDAFRKAGGRTCSFLCDDSGRIYCQ